MTRTSFIATALAALIGIGAAVPALANDVRIENMAGRTPQAASSMAPGTVSDLSEGYSKLRERPSARL